MHKLEQILDDEKYRHELFKGTTKFRFNNNKTRVLQEIDMLLDRSEERVIH